jgi:cytidylate kinase
LKPNIIIAIDGYSSCGKSTLARELARRLKLIYVDSGAMYRAVTLFFLQNKIPIPLPEQLDSVSYNYELTIRWIKINFKINYATGSSEISINGKNVEKQIRSLEVSNNVSHVSAIKAVREKLVAIQQELGQKGGIVMDGRDIGTTVFPHADIKIFMTANTEVRAKRRYDELTARGIKTTFEEILKNIAERDHEDSHRKISPLRQSPDAIVLDNTFLNEEEQVEFVLKVIKEKSLIST